MAEGIGGVCMVGACMQERRPLKRVVRILLECILVLHYLCGKCSINNFRNNFPMKFFFLSHAQYVLLPVP